MHASERTGVSWGLPLFALYFSPLKFILGPHADSSGSSR